MVAADAALRQGLEEVGEGLARAVKGGHGGRTAHHLSWTGAEAHSRTAESPRLAQEAALVEKGGKRS